MGGTSPATTVGRQVSPVSSIRVGRRPVRTNKKKRLSIPLNFLYKLGNQFVRGKRPACTEKRKRAKAGVEPAQENYGYFSPEIELSVRLKFSLSGSAPR